MPFLSRVQIDVFPGENFGLVVGGGLVEFVLGGGNLQYYRSEALLERRS